MELSSTTSSRAKSNTIGSSSTMVICLAMTLLMTLSFVLCLSVLPNLELFRRMSRDHKQCGRNVPYLSSPSSPVINRAHSVGSSRPMRMARYEIAIPGTDDATTTTCGSSCCIPDAGGNGSHLEKEESNASLITTAATPSTKKLRVFIGILSMAWKIDLRSLLRVAYGVQASDPEDAEVTIRFVLGALKDEKEKTLVGMENATYGDIIVLGCQENLDGGKTFTFFSTLPALGVEFDYVMKADDDSYLRIGNLVKHLEHLPRTDFYYGYLLPCANKDVHSMYMSGMGYLISWDLVLWIRDSLIPRNKTIGYEDKLVSDWFNEGGKAKNRVTDKPLFYHHPAVGEKCSHEFIPETILIHQVKTLRRWVEVLAYFEKDRISEALA